MKLSLMSYGINANKLPMNREWRLNVRNHSNFLQSRRIWEKEAEAGSTDPWIEIPTNRDVLLGRGKPIQSHLGNVRLNVMVDERVEEYVACGKDLTTKRRIVSDIIKGVQASSGRFLSRSTGVWKPITYEATVEKVSHLFRNRKLAHRKLFEGAKEPVSSTKVYKEDSDDDLESTLAFLRDSKRVRKS